MHDRYVLPDEIPESDVIAANIRGLEEPTEAEEGEFVYTDCLNGYDHIKTNIKSITFDISRYCKHKHTISFDSPVTQEHAIRAAEDYLSQPLTCEYFDQIKDDLFDDFTSYVEAKEYFSCRGDCLTDAKFLERATLYPDGSLHLWCGS